MYLKMAWRNIWRNKRRTFITMTSVSFAVILAIIMRSTITGTFQKMVSDVVGISSGYLQIHKKGYWSERSVDNTFEESNKLYAIIHAEKEITAWSPRLECFALASSSNRTRGIMVMGVYPDKENEVTHLKEKIIAGKYISNDDKGILIPEGLSSYLHLKIHDTIILLGQGYHGSMAAAKYPVRGIIKLGSPDLNKSICWLPMACSIDFLGTGKRLSSISLILKKEKNMESVRKRLMNKASHNNEIMTWKEMLPDLDQFIEADSSAHIITINILYFIIAFGIFGTILMMLNERMREFGILVAVGMKKRILSFIVFIEIVMISLLGAILGMICAFPLVLYFHFNPIRFTGDLVKGYEDYGMEPIIPASIDLINFTSQAYTVFSITLILSVYPFYKINKIRVIKAINS